MAAATDYDAPRVREGEEPDDQGADLLLDTRRGVRARTPAATGVDTDVAGTTGWLVLERLDTGDELFVPVVAQQANEFTCTRCFLVLHRRRCATEVGGKAVCHDCS